MDKNTCKFSLPSAPASLTSGLEVIHSCFLLWGNTTAKVINTTGNKYCSILAWAQHCTNLCLRLFGVELACVSAHRRQDPGQGIQHLIPHGVCLSWVSVGFGWMFSLVSPEEGTQSVITSFLFRRLVQIWHCSPSKFLHWSLDEKKAIPNLLSWPGGLGPIYILFSRSLH